jgi:hypothetical protein
MKRNKSKFLRRKGHQLIHGLKLLHRKMNFSFLTRTPEDILRAAKENTPYEGFPTRLNPKLKTPKLMKAAATQAWQDTVRRLGLSA